MARNPRVIVIDQDQIARSEVQKMLALSGFAVLGEAGYGIEAVSLAKEAEPDVIVIAVEDPIVRALQTVEAVADLLPQSPIVAYSSVKDPNHIRKAMLAGVSDYLITPVREEELISSIHSVLAQEERRRARISGEVEEPTAAGTVLTVFGAKGGIGKTTISTNLATALVQKTGQSVALVDLDTRFGDVAILMDIPVERSIADLAMPEDEINRELLQDCLYTHNTGVTILPAPVRPTDWRSVHAGHIERVVNLLAQTYDYVILDTPGTFNDMVGKALEVATVVLMVSTMDMASIKDTLLALDMLEGWSFPKDRIKIAINQATSANSIGLPDIKRALEREIFWHIPFDRNVSNSTQLGTPVVVSHPTSKVSESVVGMAYAISGARRPGGQARGGNGRAGGFLSRLLFWRH